MSFSFMPFLVILVALLNVVPIVVTGRNPRLRNRCMISGAALLFVLVAAMLPAVLRGEMFGLEIDRLLPGASLKLRVDAMGIFFAIVASGLWLATSFYAIGYMQLLKEHSQTRFFAFFAVAIGAALGVLGGASESLAGGNNRYALDPASAAGAAIGAAGLLFVLYRAGSVSPSGHG